MQDTTEPRFVWVNGSELRVDMTVRQEPWDANADRWEKSMWTTTWYGKWWVYFVHDLSTDDLLYVGCTNNVVRRVSEHHALRKYRRDEVRYTVEGPYQSSSSARGAERRHIRTLRPRDNHRLTGV